MPKQNHKQTIFWAMTLASLAFGQSAFAEVRVKSDEEVEAIIRRERAKVGEGIDALDSIITRQQVATEPSTYVPARYAAPEAAPHRVSERSKSPSADRSSDYYSPSKVDISERISERLKAAPVSQELEVKGEDGIRGEDVVAEAEASEPPPRVRPEPLFDMGSNKGALRAPQKVEAIPLDRQIAPTRLTEVHPTAAPQEKPSNGLWDDLTAARERARRAIVESWQGEEGGRPPVQNYPSGYADTNRFRNELSAAERLAPQQAGLVSYPAVVQEKRTATDDVIAAEVREVEQEIHPGAARGASKRLLGSLQEERSQGQELPMLRPKRIAGRIPSRRAIRSIASTLSRNTYAKGSMPGERREAQEEQYQPSTYKYVPENFYRHLTPKGAGNVRTHQAYE